MQSDSGGGIADWLSASLRMWVFVAACPNPVWADGVPVLQLREHVRLSGVPATLTVNDLLVMPISGPSAGCASKPHSIDPRANRLGRLWIERQLRICGVPRWRWAGGLQARLDVEGGERTYATAWEAIDSALRAAYGAKNGHRPEWFDMGVGGRDEDGVGLRYRVLPPPKNAGGLPAQAVLQVETHRDGRFLRQEAVQVRLSLRKEVWLAVRAIAPGEALEVSAFRRREVDVAGLPETVDAATPWMDGWQARRRIAQGQPLLRSGVQPMPDIRGGESVTASTGAGKVVLTLPAIALQDGRIGDWVRIRLAGQREMIAAQVQSDGHVEVK